MSGTQSVDTALETYHSKLLQGKESGVQTAETVSTSQKPLLGAFGSVIQDAANRHLPGIGSQKAQYENLAPQQMGEHLSSRVSGEYLDNTSLDCSNHFQAQILRDVL